MLKIVRRLWNWSKRVVRSVAFLPVPMITLGLLLGVFLFYLEQKTEVSANLGELLPSVAITSQDTARTILSMFIGGLITLTVFTFSQIMILLNQVASNYSPRLLPKLTGDWSLQFVMGFNLGTIVLLILVLITIRSSDNYRIPNLSIFICILLGVTCLCLFVYFVTTISKRIQVDSIINRTTRDCLRTLEREHHEKNFEERHLPEEAKEWYPIASPISGYVGTVNYSALSKLAKEFDTRVYIGLSKGQFLPKGLPIFRSEHPLEEPAIQRMLEAVEPVRDYFDDWYLPNLKQLTEIALRAISPGINDPATALTVVDRQTEIFSQMMTTPFNNYYCHEDGNEVWFACLSFAEVLTATMQEMRRYSREDPLLMRRLFQQLYHLLALAGESFTFRYHLMLEIRALLQDARQHLTNSVDRSLLAKEIQSHRATLRKYQSL